MASYCLLTRGALQIFLLKMSDDNWGFGCYVLNLNIRQSTQVEGFYSQLHERHKFILRDLLSDDTVIDINFAINDAMRVAARKMCPDANPEWPDMAQRDFLWEESRHAREVAIVQ